MRTTIAIDHAAAAANIEAHVREGRLRQQTWHGRDDDGRDLACLIGAIHPDIDRIEACPAALMPRWLARVTVRLFDGVAADRAADFALAYARRMHRWHVVDAPGWERVRRAFIAQTLGATIDRLSARLPDESPPLWRDIKSVLDRLLAMLLDASTPPAAYAALSDEARGLRGSARELYHDAIARRAAAVAEAALAAAVAEAALAVAGAVELAAAPMAVSAMSAPEAAKAVAGAVELAAAPMAVAAPEAAQAVAEAVWVAGAEAKTTKAAAVAIRKCCAASFDTLLRVIDAEIDARAWVADDDDLCTACASYPEDAG